jgi:hypothetical protein
MEVNHIVKLLSPELLQKGANATLIIPGLINIRVFFQERFELNLGAVVYFCIGVLYFKASNNRSSQDDIANGRKSQNEKFNGLNHGGDFGQEVERIPNVPGEGVSSVCGSITSLRVGF